MDKYPNKNSEKSEESVPDICWVGILYNFAGDAGNGVENIVWFYCKTKKKMKVMSFLAMLLAGLMSVAFVSCDKDDDEKAKEYLWKMTMALTDPGDLSDAEIEQINMTFDVFENQVYMTTAEAKALFDELIVYFEDMFSKLQVNDITKPVKITMTLASDEVGGGTMTHTFTITPPRREIDNTGSL